MSFDRSGDTADRQAAAKKAANHYVLCYTPLMRVADHMGTSHVVLILKSKPAWQAGLLNLPGGKIEQGESPIEAARRELKEETGLDAYKVEPMGQLEGDDYLVWVMRTLVPHGSIPRTCTEERIVTMWLDEVYMAKNLIPNLRLIIPLCEAGIRDWNIQDYGIPRVYRVEFK